MWFQIQRVESIVRKSGRDLVLSGTQAFVVSVIAQRPGTEGRSLVMFTFALKLHFHLSLSVPARFLYPDSNLSPDPSWGWSLGFRISLPVSIWFYNGFDV